MAKDPTHLPHAERLALLMREMNSSTCLTKADALLEVMRNEYLDVLAVRDMAARRQNGDVAPAPALPLVSVKVTPEAEPRSPPEQEPVAVGTFKNLIELYETDKRSPFHNIHFRTRENRKSTLARMTREHGARRLSDISATELRSWREIWAASGKPQMAHSFVTMLRILVNFGSTILGNKDCERLAVALHNMRAPMPQPREENVERLTEEHVRLIIEKANEMRLPSIALAQAFQYDCRLRQKSVIGEWVPISEDGTSEIIDNGMKWVRGIRFSKIDSNNILHHAMVTGGAEFELDLRTAPKVLVQFERMGKRWPCDAAIIDDNTGLPYKTVEFRRTWRRVADAAGIPKHLRNMNSHSRPMKDSEDEGSQSNSDALETDGPPARRASR